MEIVKKNVAISQKSIRALKENIVKCRPFKVQNMKEWFAGQKVHVVMRNYKGLRELPPGLDGKPALNAISVLDRSWLDHGEVAEGALKDLMIGVMRDPAGGKPQDFAISAINSLRDTGFISFSDPDGNLGENAWSHRPISQIWFRLNKKFFDIIIADPVE